MGLVIQSHISMWSRLIACIKHMFFDGWDFCLRLVQEFDHAKFVINLLDYFENLYAYDLTATEFCCSLLFFTWCIISVNWSAWCGNYSFVDTVDFFLSGYLLILCSLKHFAQFKLLVGDGFICPQGSSREGRPICAKAGLILDWCCCFKDTSSP